MTNPNNPDLPFILAEHIRRQDSDAARVKELSHNLAYANATITMLCGTILMITDSWLLRLFAAVIIVLSVSRLVTLWRNWGTRQ